MGRLRNTLKAGFALLAPRSLVVWRGPGDCGKVALTFDDGPHPEWTPRILDVLDAARVPGTFFMVGRNVLRHPDLAREIRRRGHVVGGHSNSHRRLQYFRLAAIREEIDRGNAAIEAALGTTTSLFRPPFGALSPYLLYSAARRGLTVVLWSVNSQDWGWDVASLLAGVQCPSVKPGDILLFHDNNPRTAVCLPEVIQGLRDQGLEFATIPDFLAGEFPALHEAFS